jgi:adenylate kinase family enzyme
MNINSEKPSEIYFKEKGKFYIYNKSEICPYTLKDITGDNRNFSLIFGLPYTGKSYFCKHFVQNQGYECLDLNEVIKKIKELKNPDDPDSVELVPKDLINEIVSVLDNPANKNKRFIIDNINNNLLLPEFEQIKQFLDALGTPKTFYNLKCEEKILRLRYKKIKLDNTDPQDLNEGELEEYQNTLVLPDKIIKEIQNMAFQTVEVDTSGSENITRQIFEKTNGKKIIFVKHDYNNINMEVTLNNLASEYQALYINVPRLIYEKFYENKSSSQELKKFYSMVSKLEGNCPDLEFDESIYYKYNSIHFEDEVVLNLIKEHINKNCRQMEKTGLVILTGFLNTDLLCEERRKFSIPLKEIKNIFSLGELYSFIQITEKELETNEKLEEVFLEPPVKKVTKKVDPLDVDGENDGNIDGDMDNMDMDNMDGDVDGGDPDDPEAKKPYNPYNKSWTDYNGKPRNYLQILSKLTHKDVKKYEAERGPIDAKKKFVEIFSSLISEPEENKNSIHYIKYSKC